MITGQTLTLTILPDMGDESLKIAVTALSNCTTELTTKGGKILVRTATLIALGRKLEAVFPNAVKETVE